MIIKNDIPILEYDSDQNAVIMPNSHDIADFPEKCIFGFLGDEIDKYAREFSCEVMTYFETITKMFPIYRVNYKGEELTMCQAPLGGAAAVHILDFLIGHGVKYIVASGSCGALVPFEENKFLLPIEALRDEGASYHYLPPSRTVKLNEAAVSSVEKTLNALGIESQRTRTWTTDAFYRETKSMVEARREEGFSVVDMECASMAACAEFRGVKFAQILFTADSLADTESYDERDFGKLSMASALRLSLECVLNLDK